MVFPETDEYLWEGQMLEEKIRKIFLTNLNDLNGDIKGHISLELRKGQGWSYDDANYR